MPRGMEYLCVNPRRLTCICVCRLCSHADLHLGSRRAIRGVRKDEDFDAWQADAHAQESLKASIKNVRCVAARLIPLARLPGACVLGLRPVCLFAWCLCAWLKTCVPVCLVPVCLAKGLYACVPGACVLG